VNVEKEMTGQWAMFLEYAGDYASAHGARQLLHTGMTDRSGQRQQIDAHVGFGLSAGAPSHLVGVGYSFRLNPDR